MANAPGRSDRETISLMELFEMFPTEDSAREWFENRIWPNGRHCPRCGNTETIECTGKPPMPYYCPACKRHFSVRIGTILESSKVSLKKWVIAIYLHLTSLKGVSSMKLHNDIQVTQKTAWFMLQRIRKAFEDDDDWPFGGPIEVDEAYFGGKEANKHADKKLNAGGGTVGKTVVAGAKDRASGHIDAQVVPDTTKRTLHGFVEERADFDATVYTDEHVSYEGIPFDHESVKHSVSEYVRDQAHVNGLESFWALLKRGYHGTYHHMSGKHLERYINEFAGRHNDRPSDTIDQMAHMAQGMTGKQLRYQDLIAGGPAY